MVMLYSSSMGMAQVGAHYLVKQLVGCAIGIVLCLMAAALDYRRLKKFAWPLFALAVVLLVLVFLPHIGIRRNGASRWLGYGKTSLFQPSEFAKLALIIVLAWYCEWFQRQMPTLKTRNGYSGLVHWPGVRLDFQRAGCGQHAAVGHCKRRAACLIGGIRLRYFLPPVIVGVP
jgi:cell division protein FtsW (lipid II flippase)